MRPFDVQLLFLNHSELEGCAHHAYSHIEFIFPINLPKKYDIDGASKINIIYGAPHPPRGWYIPGRENGSISEIYFPDFDPSKIKEAKPKEREIIATELIRDGLINLCKHRKTDSEPVREAARQTIEAEFRHGWVHTKTSKSTSDRRFRLETHLQIGSEGIDVEFVFLRSKEIIHREAYPSERFYDSIWFDLWSIEWQGQSAVIRDRVRNVVRIFNVHVNNSVEQVATGKGFQPSPAL